MVTCTRLAASNVSASCWKTKGTMLSSQLMHSKGEEIFYRVKDDRDRKWAKLLECVVKQHLDRAEDEMDQLQGDFVALLRQCKDVRERKYDQEIITSHYKQLETARMTIRDLLR